MSYRVVLKPSAEKELSQLPRSMQHRVIEKLAQIQFDPRPVGSVKLAGSKSAHRLRVGDYRIVYEVNEVGGTVFVTIIAHRREVYRGL